MVCNFFVLQRLWKVSTLKAKGWIAKESSALSGQEFLNCWTLLGENGRFATHALWRKNHSGRTWLFLQYLQLVSNALVFDFFHSGLDSHLTNSFIDY